MHCRDQDSTITLRWYSVKWHKRYMELRDDDSWCPGRHDKERVDYGRMDRKVAVGSTGSVTEPPVWIDSIVFDSRANLAAFVETRDLMTTKAMRSCVLCAPM